jgi:hydrogenase expression/formation protein HypC
MCLAFPMKLVEVDGLTGRVLEGSIRREVRLDLVDPSPEVGQYLLIHAGYAIQVLDEQEALETLELIRQAYPALSEGGDE